MVRPAQDRSYRSAAHPGSLQRIVLVGPDRLGLKILAGQRGSLGSGVLQPTNSPARGRVHPSEIAVSRVADTRGHGPVLGRAERCGPTDKRDALLASKDWPWSSDTSSTTREHPNRDLLDIEDSRRQDVVRAL